VANDSGEPEFGPIRFIIGDALLGIVSGVALAGVILLAVVAGLITPSGTTAAALTARDFKALGAYAVVYAVAGGVLGALAPYTQRTRRAFAVYGFVGVCVATALIVITSRAIPSPIATGGGAYGAVAVVMAVAFMVGRARSLGRARGGVGLAK
jgi:hypothetical protein